MVAAFVDIGGCPVVRDACAMVFINPESKWARNLFLLRSNHSVERRQSRLLCAFIPEMSYDSSLACLVLRRTSMAAVFVDILRCLVVRDACAIVSIRPEYRSTLNPSWFRSSDTN